MKICVIGAGYVGLTTSAFFAELGHDVQCIDCQKEKIEDLNKGNITIFEPGLADLINKNRERLHFHHHTREAIASSSAIFITVGTPTLSDGSTDLSFLYSVIKDIASTIKSYKTIIIKSTVPPGTATSIKKLLHQNGVDSTLFNIVSNPEFLREGSAIQDMFSPSRTVVGLCSKDTKSADIMRELYQGIEAPLIVTNWNGAEMIKYASNAFLATKISFINEIARICEAYQADITDVSLGMGLDPRIGPLFLQAGIGFGGSCFPKDLYALQYSAQSKNVTPTLLRAAQSVNNTQLNVYIDKWLQHFPTGSTKKVAVLGVSFKPNTDDIRESQAISLIERLCLLGFEVNTYDPVAKLPPYLADKAIQHATLEDAIKQSESIFIATEWDEFKQLNWREVKHHLKGHLVIDGRNCVSPQEVEDAGLTYLGVGRI